MITKRPVCHPSWTPNGQLLQGWLSHPGRTPWKILHSPRVCLFPTRKQWWLHGRSSRALSRHFFKKKSLAYLHNAILFVWTWPLRRSAGFIVVLKMGRAMSQEVVCISFACRIGGKGFCQHVCGNGLWRTKISLSDCDSEKPSCHGVRLRTFPLSFVWYTFALHSLRHPCKWATYSAKCLASSEPDLLTHTPIDSDVALPKEFWPSDVSACSITSLIFSPFGPHV